MVTGYWSAAAIFYVSEATLSYIKFNRNPAVCEAVCLNVFIFVSESLEQDRVTILNEEAEDGLPAAAGWRAGRNKCPSSHQAVAIQPPMHKHPSLQPHLSAGQSGERARFVVSVSERPLKNVITRTDRRSMARLVVQAHFKHMMLTLQRPHWQTQQYCRGKKTPNDARLPRHAEEARVLGGNRMTCTEWEGIDHVLARSGGLKVLKATFVFVFRKPAF